MAKRKHPRKGHKMKRRKNPGVRIVHNKLLGGWFIVRGPHQTPIGGRFNSKAEAQAHLQRKKNPIGTFSRTQLDRLAHHYKKIKTIAPSGPGYNKLAAYLDPHAASRAQATGGRAYQILERDGA